MNNINVDTETQCFYLRSLHHTKGNSEVAKKVAAILVGEEANALLKQLLQEEKKAIEKRMHLTNSFKYKFTEEQVDGALKEAKNKYPELFI